MKKKLPNVNLNLADRAWFDLKRWSCESPPFVAGMSIQEKVHLRQMCYQLVEAIDKLIATVTEGES